MVRKLALKRLTKSDLTIFEWHFRNRNAGNQKSINLNADVFVSELYPSVPTLALTNGNEMPISVSIFGPGTKPELALARKIIKGAAYKNWRLNGEFIFNPASDPERFNLLLPGDLAVLEFTGDPKPTSLRMFLLAADSPADKAIYGPLDTLLGARRMATISKRQLENAVDSSGLSPDHPLNELVLDSSLEDAALGGYRGMRSLLKRSSGARVTRHELAQARDEADRVAEIGSELAFEYLSTQQQAGALAELDWPSKHNAILPYDFTAVRSTGPVMIRVKATRGPFRSPLHFSLVEFRGAADSVHPYCVGTSWTAAGKDFNCRKRSRTRTQRFGAYTEPNHRAIAAYLADIKDERAVRNANTALAAMKDPSRGVLLFYPVRQQIGDPVSIGFALLFPKNGLPFQLRFSVRDPRQPNAITVPSSMAATP